VAYWRFAPFTLYLRARQEWAELLPHLKQIGTQVVSQGTLPKWDRNFGDLQAKVGRARAVRARRVNRFAKEE
jgi:hypothetical protein